LCLLPERCPSGSGRAQQISGRDVNNVDRFTQQLGLCTFPGAGRS
jgi:hypothetical protein